MAKMPMSRVLGAFAAVALSFISSAAAGDVWKSVADGSQPPVYMASDGTRISLRAEPLDGATPRARLVAARSRIRAKNISSFPDSTDVSPLSLGDGDLRLYLRVTWEKDGAVRRAETYFSPSLGDREPVRPEGMTTFDLDAFVAQCEAEASRIVIPFDMPFDGRATVALDDGEGRRVRNLVNGRRFSAGANSVEWDGRREDGTVAAAGEYSVRVVASTGLSYDYTGSFANGGEKLWKPYGPNHCAFTSLVLGPDGKISASSLFTEGGDSTVVMDAATGAKRHGWGESWNYGNEALYHVCGKDQAFYSVREGYVDHNGEKKSVFQMYAYRWDATWRPDVRVDLADASVIPGQDHAIRVGSPAWDGRPALMGAAKVGDYLFVSDRRDSRVHVYYCTEDGAGSLRVRSFNQSIPMEDAGAVTLVNGEVYVASGGKIYLVRADGYSQYLFTLATGAKPSAMTSDGTNLYCLHEGHHLVYVYRVSDGAFVKTIGSSDDGDYTGAWDSNRLVNPTALCCDSNGKLWITENRMSPKRLSRWNTSSGTCEYEKVGGEQYGSPGAGMDDEDSGHWIAENAEWRVNLQTGEERVVGKLLPESRSNNGAWNVPQNMNRMYKWVRRAGRTFVLANNESTTLYELKDHRLVPLAFVSTPGIYSGFLGREHPCEAAWQSYKQKFWWKNKNDFLYDEYTPMLWKDYNRNGLLDADEIEYGENDTTAQFGYWGDVIVSLDFVMAVKEGDGMSMLTFNAGSMEGDSLPDWSIANAWNSRKKCPDAIPDGGTLPFHHECYSDSEYAIIPTASPYMLGYRADGRLAWYMDSIFPSVHGSHDAPLPVYGEVQSLLFSLGSVNVGGRTVVAWQNNHGVIYFITSDGIFVDQLFSDCRVAGLSDESFIGGEPFGGSFSLAADGTPTLQAGGGGCRVYAIRGLDSLREQPRGRISVTDEQIAAAVRLNPSPDEAAWTAPSLVLPYRAEGSSQGMLRVAEWVSGSNRVKLDGSWNEQAMKLRYTVEESTPWVNNGFDPYMMFKTGDCVDMQLGVPGLMRIQVSREAGGGNGQSVVRYRFQTDDPGASPRDYNSPTRQFRVDDVSLRSDVGVSVSVEGGRYTVNLVVPHSVTGLDGNSLAGTSLPADFGVIFGDEKGEIDLSRAYWSNKSTVIVNDVPEEIVPKPAKWGSVVFGPAGDGGSGTTAANSPRDAVFAGYLGNPGNFRAVETQNDPLFYNQKFGIGPAYDASRGVIWSGAGTARIAKFRPDGTLLAMYTLPGAAPFSRLDKMALMDDGSIVLIAGGSISANLGDDRSGKLYRIAADAPDGSNAEELHPGVPVNGISSRARNGKILLHRRGGQVYEYAPYQQPRQIGSFMMPNGFYSVGMMDWDRRGTLHFFEGARWLYTFAYGNDGMISTVGDPVVMFGDWEIACGESQFAGDALWFFDGDTIKRFDDVTFKPAPGVVKGGSSGYFIGTVDYNGELNPAGIAEISKDLYAVSGHRNGTTYLLKWNATEDALEEVGRMGVVLNGRSLSVDDAGYVYVDGLVWKIGDSAKSAPRKAMGPRTEYGAATMPNGRVVAIGRSGEVRYGFLSEGLSTFDQKFDMSGVSEEAEEVGSYFRTRNDGTYELVRFDSYARAYVFRFKEDGTPIVDAGWSNFYEWPVPGNISVGGLSIDAGRIAITDTGAGTLKVLRLSDGYELARVDGLVQPTRCAMRGEHLVVYESGAQRLSAFKLAVPAQYTVEGYADPTIQPGDYYWDRGCESGYWGEASKWRVGSVDGAASAFAPDGTKDVIAVFSGADARIDLGSGEFFNIVLKDNSTLRIALNEGAVLRAADISRNRWNGSAIDTDYGSNNIFVSGGTLDLNGSGFYFWHDGNTIEAIYGGRIEGFSVRNNYHDEGFRNVFRARDGGAINGSGAILYAPSGDLLEASNGNVAFTGDVYAQGSGTAQISVAGASGSITAARITRDGDASVALVFAPSSSGRTAQGAYLTLTGDNALPGSGVTVAVSAPAEWDSSFPEDGAVALVEIRNGDASALSAIAANTPRDAVAGGELRVSSDGRTLYYVRTRQLVDELGYEGAEVSQSGEWTVLKWSGEGTVTVPSDCRIDVLLVGGGGGGGTLAGGGGGGGGVVYEQGHFVRAGEYTIRVGAGGAGATYEGGASGRGGDTTAFGLVALGGGAGGGYGFGDNGYWDGSVAGGGGGCGGGAGGHRADLGAGTPTPGSGTSGQGRDGGAAISQHSHDMKPELGAGGGGGGAWTQGGAAFWNDELGLIEGGKGGDGALCDITGEAVRYGGGGGGGTSSNYHTLYAAGGLGGGGAGGFNNTSHSIAVPGGDGTDGLGGGGGGAGCYTTRYDFDENKGATGGRGGSGIVIVRYSKLSFSDVVNVATASHFEINQSTSKPYFGSDASAGAMLDPLRNAIYGRVPSFTPGTIRSGMGNGGAFWETQTSNWGCLTDGLIPQHPKEYDGGRGYDELSSARYLVPDNSVLEWSFPETDLASVRLWTQWPDGNRNDIAVKSIQVRVGGEWVTLANSEFCSGKNVNATVKNDIEPYMDASVKKRCVFFGPVWGDVLAAGATGLRIVFPEQELGYTCFWEIEAERAVPLLRETPNLSGISASGGKVVLSVDNAQKGIRYGYRFAERLEDLATAPIIWLDGPAAADGLLPLEHDRNSPSGFYRIVAE
jgi:hypothetical protein